jgi:hypothetical protein
MSVHQKGGGKPPASQRETAVTLDHLPPGLDFPADYPEPIRFDPDHHRLVYLGVMLNASYTHLRRLSHDPAYLAAVDDLYVLSALPVRSAGGWGWWLLLALALAGVALAGALWWHRG